MESDKKAKILIIEDDITFCTMLERFLVKNGFHVTTSYSAAEARIKLNTSHFHLVFTDLRLPDSDGIKVLSEVKEKYKNTPVILMTSYAEVQTAVKAMKEGAFDYISKPFNPDEVIGVIHHALKAHDVSESSEKFVSEDHKPETLPTNNTSTYVTGISAASKKLNHYIQLVGPTTMSVLIIGESGTGKELVARAIHENSARKSNGFVAVDCGAIPKEIATSEFFGHRKGSFTGAIDDKKGHFEAANGGTLFLDEIGNLSYENQIQLLRAIQERKVKPIGSNTEIDVDIRLIAATNEDLQLAVQKDEFREDLYHRLNEFSIDVPSLSERMEDLIIFADYFLEKANAQLHKHVIGFSDEVIAVFQNYSWPGNLRELQNVIKRSALLTQDNFIQKEVLPYEVVNGSPTKPEPQGFSTKEHEKALIVRALQETGNNKTRAAKLLNITRKTLYNKLKEYNLHQFVF